MSIDCAQTIDVHAHVVLEATMGSAGKYGPELGESADRVPWFRVANYVLNGIKYRNSAFMDPVLRLQRMRESGVDFQVLSPNPLNYFHHIAVVDAVNFCRVHNDALFELIAPHRNQLGALVALPMQDVEAAMEELERTKGRPGMLGACIGANLSVPLDNPALDPFYEKVSALNVPLFIHPAPPATEGLAVDSRLSRFDFEVTIGFSTQETLAAATLIIGGVLDRHPGLDICISHGGGAIAFIAGRLASASKSRPWAPECLKQDGAFEERLHRLWFDTHVHDPRSLVLLKQVASPDRLVYGSNFSGWDQVADCKRESAAVGLDLAGNARRLLRAAVPVKPAIPAGYRDGNLTEPAVRVRDDPESHR